MPWLEVSSRPSLIPWENGSILTIDWQRYSLFCCRVCSPKFELSYPIMRVHCLIDGFLLQIWINTTNSSISNLYHFHCLSIKINLHGCHWWHPSRRNILLVRRIRWLRGLALNRIITARITLLLGRWTCSTNIYLQLRIFPKCGTSFLLLMSTNTWMKKGRKRSSCPWMIFLQ